MKRSLHFSLLMSLSLFVSACITVVPTTNQPSASSSPLPLATANPQPTPTPPLVIPSSQPTTIPGTLPSAMVGYEDMFEKPENLTNGWIIEDAPGTSSGPSRWLIENGKLVQNSNIYRNDEEFAFFEGTRAITRQGPWPNARISVKINPTDNDGIGMIFRYQNADNYYRLLSVQDTINAGPFTRLEVKQNGKFRTLAEDKLPLHETDNPPVLVSISASGQQITVEIDGKQRFQVSDNTFTAGKAGLTTYACSAEFSEFRVQLLP